MSATMPFSAMPLNDMASLHVCMLVHFAIWQMAAGDKRGGHGL